MNWIEIKNIDHNYYLKYKIPRERGLIAPLKAAHKTIEYIVKNYPSPYTLMLSGGVDSQAMLYAWHTSGHKFNTFSAVYNNNLNDNDLSTLKEFSSVYNIPINYYNFDLLHFLQNEHLNYVYKYRCGSPHMTTFMKLSQYINTGTVLMSGNFIASNDTTLPISKNNFSLYRYSKIENKPMIPFFFCETQELAFSFLLKTHIDDTLYVNGKRHHVENSLQYVRKVQTYIDNEFPVIPQKLKYTGFELVKDLYDEKYSYLLTARDKLAISGRQKSLRTFDLLLRNKYEMMFDVDKYIVSRENDYARKVKGCI